MPASDPLIAQIDDVLADARRLGPSQGYSSAPDDAVARVKTRALAALDRIAPPRSPYRDLLQTSARMPYDWWVLSKAIPALQALRADLEGGYVRRLAELVHGELFDDFLDMAEHLLAEGYKDPAAVVAGSVLEEHVRKLAEKYDVSTDSNGRPRSVEQMGVDLKRADVVSETERKIVQGWYGQRTEAAHGRYENVIAEEIGRMIQGVRDFMVRHPA